MELLVIFSRANFLKTYYSQLLRPSLKLAFRMFHKTLESNYTTNQFYYSPMMTIYIQSPREEKKVATRNFSICKLKKHMLFSHTLHYNCLHLSLLEWTATIIIKRRTRQERLTKPQVGRYTQSIVESSQPSGR